MSTFNIIDCRERFYNALDESLKYPEFKFWHEDMPHIKAGVQVKVASNGERFWTTVLQVIDEDILAEVDNILIFNPDLQYQALVWFTKEHIYSTNIPPAASSTEVK